MARLAQLNEAEVERARRYAAGLVQIGRQTAAAITGEILTAWVNGRLEDLPELPERLRAVTVEQIIGEAEEVFQPSVRAEFVVRGG